MLRLRRVLADRSVVTGQPVLAMRPVLIGPPVPCQRVLAGLGMRAVQVRETLPMRPGAGAVAQPDGTRAQHAPKFTGARQVRPVPGPQREVLGLTRQVARQVMPGAGAPGRRGGDLGAREAVVGIRPGAGLLRVEPRLAYPVG
ncbi:MAG TPA: hypothetical protein VEL03_03105 [Streptosporangiaceae bacterium]|nr:hypothetical protein [Streptosporangiaceae bacterium]